MGDYLYGNDSAFARLRHSFDFQRELEKQFATTRMIRDALGPYWELAERTRKYRELGSAFAKVSRAGSLRALGGVSGVPSEPERDPIESFTSAHINYAVSEIRKSPEFSRYSDHRDTWERGRDHVVVYLIGDGGCIEFKISVGELRVMIQGRSMARNIARRVIS